MRSLRKNSLASFVIVLFFFVAFLLPQEARADNLIITSGSVSIGGAPFSRNAWRAISFNFSGNNFNASGGEGDADFRQQINTPCGSGLCSPGTAVSSNSVATLLGNGHATFNSTTVDAWWRGADSQLTFTGPDIIIPDSTAEKLTVTTSFTMTGSVFVHDLNTASFPVIFSTDVSGAGVATLTFQYFPNLGPGGYILSNVRYDFTAVPEPATLIMLGTGLAGIAARLRRRRQ